MDGTNREIRAFMNRATEIVVNIVSRPGIAVSVRNTSIRAAQPAEALHEIEWQRGEFSAGGDSRGRGRATGRRAPGGARPEAICVLRVSLAVLTILRSSSKREHPLSAQLIY